MSEFEAILPLKVESIAELLMENHNISLQDALEMLYSSQLYALLEDEETKMWHYSPQMLTFWLEEEKRTGTLRLPQ